ncbi:MAG: hypothetical protein ACRC6M_09160, partial [Microcystaceae cyanobacterium]
MTDPKSTNSTSDPNSQENFCRAELGNSIPKTSAKVINSTSINTIYSKQKPWYLWGALTGATIGICGSVWFGGQYFVKTQIAPLVSNSLAYMLNRPVKIGPLESATFYSLRFGSSEILPVGKDPDRITFKTLEITFNPLDYLYKKKLFINATVIEPNLYLEQGKNGNWLQTAIAPLDPSFPIDLQQLQLKQAQITLLARNPVGKLKAPVPIRLEYLKLDLNQVLTKNKLNFALKGQLANRGQLILKGLWNTAQQNINL